MIRRMEKPPRGHPQLAVATCEEDGVRVIALAGELDLHSVAEFDAALVAASAGPQPRVCLDLTGLRFIDSSGLAAIIRAHVMVAEAAGAFAIAAGGIVHRTLETTGLLEMLNVVADRATALADLA
jgi:anti-sigma B factor antagonist